MNNKDIDLVKKVVETRADCLAILRSDSSSFLFSGIMMELTDIVKFFIESGADINTRDKNGGSLLSCAVLSGNIELVEFLIDKGANRYAKTYDGLTPLGEAIRYGEPEIVKYLLSYEDSLYVKENGSMLLDAVFYGRVEPGNIAVMKLLLDRGANPNGDLSKTKQPGFDSFVTKCYDPPLERAATSGYTEFVKLLIKYGAEFDSRWNISVRFDEDDECAEDISNIYDAAGVADNILKAKQNVLSCKKHTSDQFSDVYIQLSNLYGQREIRSIDSSLFDVVIDRLKFKLIKFGIPNKCRDFKEYMTYIKNVCSRKLPKELMLKLTNKDGTGAIDLLKQNLTQNHKYRLLSKDVVEEVSSVVEKKLGKMLDTGIEDKKLVEALKLLGIPTDSIENHKVTNQKPLSGLYYESSNDYGSGYYGSGGYGGSNELEWNPYIDAYTLGGV